jgi:hypothetical protein
MQLSREALGPDFTVGIISYADPYYGPNRWWNKAKASSELGIAYLPRHPEGTTLLEKDLIHMLSLNLIIILGLFYELFPRGHPTLVRQSPA